MNSLSPESITQIKHTLIELGVRYGPRLFTATLILVIGVLLARRLRKFTHRFLGKQGLEPPVQTLIARMLALLVLAMFLFMALQNLGVDLLPLLASLGIAGVGVGLAMQGVLSNLVAGLTIIFTRPFRVGEYVSMIGVEGQVESIELFSTTLVHFDTSKVVVPNRKIVGEILHNYGKIRQLELSLHVAYASDLSQVLSLVQAVLAENKQVLSEPRPVVGVSLLADSAITVSVKPWVSITDYVRGPDALYRALVTTCQKNGIAFPFPQREVRLLSAPIQPSPDA